MLKINNLYCGYKNFSLQNINLSIQKGQIFGLIGPNGCGKTTLLKAIDGLIVPKKGSIILDGEDICKISKKTIAKKVAFVSQDAPLVDLKVIDFVLLGRIPYFDKFQFWERKIDLEIAKKSLELVGVLDFKDRYFTNLSSGERQLILIAKALCQEPKLLLLDEPTNHLDINHQIRILNLIKKLNKELDLTVIIVLHDLNLAAQYCQFLALLSCGKLYKAGTVEEVLDKKILKDVYKIDVVIEKNPISKKPYIFLVSEEK